MPNDTLDLLAEAGITVAQPPVQQQQTNTPNIPAEPPAASAEPAKPAETAAPAQPQWNFDEELVKSTDGRVKTSAELAEILTKYGQISDFESRLTDLDKENAELKAKVNTDPFANELSKKFNDLLKGGAKPEQVDAFLKLNKHDNFESMSPYDVKLLALQVKEGLTEKEAKTYLESTYKLNADDNDEETIAREQIRLKVDARADREFLAQHKAQVSMAPVSQAEQQQIALQQQHTEHIAKLTPIAQNALKGINFTNQNINGKTDDKAIFADFTPSPASMQALPEKVAQFVQSEGVNIPANDEGAKRIEDFAKSLLILENYQAWQQHAVNVTEKKIREEYHNPSVIERGPDSTQHQGNSDKDARVKFVTDYYKL
jgi:hypothetical protein